MRKPMFGLAAALVASAMAAPAAAERWVAYGTGVTTENDGRMADFVALIDLDAVRRVGEVSKVQLVLHYPQGQYLKGWSIDREVDVADLDCGRRTSLLVERYGHGYWSYAQPRPAPTRALYDFRLSDTAPGRPAAKAPEYKPSGLDSANPLFKLVCQGDADLRPFWQRAPFDVAGGGGAAGGAWTSLAAALADVDRMRTVYLEKVNHAQLASTPAAEVVAPKLPWKQGYLSWGWGDAAWLDLRSVQVSGKLIRYRIITFDKGAPAGDLYREEEREVVCALQVRRTNKTWMRRATGLVETPGWIGFANWYGSEGMERIYLCKQDFKDAKVVSDLTQARAAYEAHEAKMARQRNGG